MPVRTFLHLCITFTLLSLSASADPCHPDGAPDTSFSKGLLTVPLNYKDLTDNRKIDLYWEKFPATQSPSKGAVFFLAGGPMPHFLFHGKKSAYKVPELFPDYDIYMWDYRGYNCSSLKKSPAELKGISQFFDTETFARDFLSLKNALVGPKARVLLFGGSFGGILGSQILADFPSHVEKAVLFSSDVHSDWWYRSMGQLNSIVSKILPKSHSSFESDWEEFRRQVSDGSMVLFKGKPNEAKVSDESLEMYLWFIGQSIAAQEGLPSIVAEALKGKLSALEQIHSGYEEFRKPLKQEPAPTLESAVLRLYVCNTFFPKSTRSKLATKPLQFGAVSTKGLVSYFAGYCSDYADFPERPFDLRKKIRPTSIPVLYWVGDRDWFDFRTSTWNMRRFGPNVETHVMHNWAHDVGLDPKSGVQTMIKMVREFLDDSDLAPEFNGYPATGIVSSVDASIHNE